MGANSIQLGCIVATTLAALFFKSQNFQKYLTTIAGSLSGSTQMNDLVNRFRALQLEFGSILFFFFETEGEWKEMKWNEMDLLIEKSFFLEWNRVFQTFWKSLYSTTMSERYLESSLVFKPKNSRGKEPSRS
jgi:hypothetical protein